MVDSSRFLSMLGGTAGVALSLPTCALCTRSMTWMIPRHLSAFHRIYLVCIEALIFTTLMIWKVAAWARTMATPAQTRKWPLLRVAAYVITTDNVSKCVYLGDSAINPWVFALNHEPCSLRRPTHHRDGRGRSRSDWASPSLSAHTFAVLARRSEALKKRARHSGIREAVQREEPCKHPCKHVWPLLGHLSQALRFESTPSRLVVWSVRLVSSACGLVGNWIEPISVCLRSARPEQRGYGTELFEQPSIACRAVLGRKCRLFNDRPGLRWLALSMARPFCS